MPYLSIVVLGGLGSAAVPNGGDYIRLTVRCRTRIVMPENEIVLTAIETHRHRAKNAAIEQTSFKLGLRVQELVLLRFREVSQIRGGVPARLRAEGHAGPAQEQTRGGDPFGGT